jgi:hypothetical protein
MLELVAGHARPGDLSHDRGLDPEVREARHERLRDALTCIGIRPTAALRSLQEAAVGELVLGEGGFAEREQALLRLARVGVFERIRFRHEELRRRSRDRVGDEIRVVLAHVDGRRDPHGELARRIGLRGRAGGANARMRLPDGVTRPAHECAETCARQEQQPGNGEEDSEDRRARRAETERHQSLEAVPGGAAVRRAEGQQ